MSQSLLIRNVAHKDAFGLDPVADDVELEQLEFTGTLDGQANGGAAGPPNSVDGIGQRHAAGVLAVDADDDVEGQNSSALGRRISQRGDNGDAALLERYGGADSLEGAFKIVAVKAVTFGADVHLIGVAEAIDHPLDGADAHRVVVEGIRIDEVVLEDVEDLVDDGELAAGRRPSGRYERR